MLRAAGYPGPVDRVINAHPFFDASVPAEKAGGLIAHKVTGVREVLKNPGQRLVVTENCWPRQGNANGRVVPGRKKHRVTVSLIVDVYGEPRGSDSVYGVC